MQRSETGLNASKDFRNLVQSLWHPILTLFYTHITKSLRDKTKAHSGST